MPTTKSSCKIFRLLIIFNKVKILFVSKATSLMFRFYLIMEICLGLEVLEGFLTIPLWLCFRVTDIQSFVSSTVLCYNKFSFAILHPCLFSFFPYWALTLFKANSCFHWFFHYVEKPQPADCMYSCRYLLTVHMCGSSNFNFFSF